MASRRLADLTAGHEGRTRGREREVHEKVREKGCDAAEDDEGAGDGDRREPMDHGKIDAEGEDDRADARKGQVRKGQPRAGERR